MLRVALLFLVVVAVAAGEVLVADSTPASWFWGDVDGSDFLTRIQTERAPNFCRSSWIHGVAAALSDRLKISSVETASDVVLSSQVLLNCVPDGGCDGGDPLEALKYIHDVGIPDETCQNYEGKKGTCDALGNCRDCKHGERIGRDFVPLSICWAVKTYQTYGLKAYGVLDAESEASMVEAMKKEIHENGPITCKMQVTSEFEDYTGGIATGGASENGEPHYINVVGWDDVDGSKYWIVRNCWGNTWGKKGFGKVEMGVNAFGLETKCFWGIPYAHLPSENAVEADNIIDRGLYRVRRDALGQESCSCAFVPEGHVPQPRLSRPEATNSELPASYDIRNIDGKNYATLDKNQHIPQYCGSCWVFAPLSALADRFSLMYKESSHLFDFSSQVANDCFNFFGSGCHGGWSSSVYYYVAKVGIPHESCSPYQALELKCNSVNKCKSCQEDGSCDAIPEEKFQHFYLEDYGEVLGEAQMKRELFTAGPLSCRIYASEEFIAYAGGIFEDSTKSERGPNHAIEVTGWGVEDGVEYWIVRNSWGTYWGENGWGRVAIGPYDLGLGANECIWATPKPLEDGTLPFGTSPQKETQIV